LKKRKRIEPTAVGDLVQEVLRAMRPPRTGPLARIRKVWPSIVGPAAAERTRIVAYSSGVLRVDLESAALRHHLQTMRRVEVLQGLSERLEGLAVKEVRYRIGPLS